MKAKMMVVAALLTGFAVFGAVAQSTPNAPANQAPAPVEAQAQNPVNVPSNVAPAQNQPPAPPAPAQEVSNDDSKSGSALKYIAAAIAVGIACIAGGMAVGKIGAAAMGAMSENAELSGKALPFVGLAEGICLWGFLVALLIIIL